MDDMSTEYFYTKTIKALLLGSSVAALLTACNNDHIAPVESYKAANGELFLAQGWTAEEREHLSFTSFGSRLLNYAWFVALEQPENDKLFRDSAHMQKLGFIASESNGFNPDGLPVGIARDDDGKGNSWMGLTCAACHTGQMHINGQPIRIDGGQSLINYTQFETELLAALKATLAEPEKWQRFLARLSKLPKSQSTTDSPDQIKKLIKARITELEQRYAINASEVPYGQGRLDAFGQIFNAIAVEALHIPGNRRSPDAPTSFPVLWDASHLDVVQWNASAPNKEPGPLAQNATTALAVYGTVTVLGQGVTYPSSTKIQNLGYLQSEFYKLTAPKWPVEQAGALDKNLMAQGEKIYQQQCLQCHSLVDEKNPKRQLVAVAVPATVVGTDPLMVNNFSDGKVKTGELEGKHTFLWFGDKFGAESARLDLVMHVTLGSLARHPWDTLRALIKEFEHNLSAKLDDNVRYYKARPINGIWASAPYLHNGSVPSVYDLLLPAAQRPAQFYVGNRELDKVKVGSVSEPVEGTTLFDTHLRGNSNQGHEYGTQLTEPERMALLEYIKSL